MKLQVALDTLNIDECLNLLDEIHEVVDIVEVGTPFIVREGVKPVKIFKEHYDDIEVFADIKIMDGGLMESRSALDLGADIVSVMAVTNDETIQTVIDECHKYHKKALIDMMNYSDLKQGALKFEGMGADYICVHTAFDTQNKENNPISDLKAVCEVIDSSKTAVAGGINLKTIDMVAKLNPAIVIVGGCIANAKDRTAMAIELKKHLEV